MSPKEFIAALKALGLSQRAFAREIEYHHNQVNNWAQGHSPVPMLVAEHINVRIAKRNK